MGQLSWSWDLSNNGAEAVAAAFRSALALLKRDRVADALGQLTGRRDLGISFGSKHPKFLDPSRAVVLDSIISGRLGYLPTIDGYIWSSWATVRHFWPRPWQLA